MFVRKCFIAIYKFVALTIHLMLEVCSYKKIDAHNCVSIIIFRWFIYQVHYRITIHYQRVTATGSVDQIDSREVCQLFCIFTNMAIWKTPECSIT